VTVKPEKSTRDKGTAVHRTIREQLGRRLREQYGDPVKVRLSDASSKPYKIGGCGSEKLGEVIGGPRTGAGDIDLAFRLAGWKDMYIAEIKPAKWDCLAAGIEQLGNYVQKANASDEAKKTYNVTSFTPMPPVHEATRLPIYAEGKMFEIQWCLPGIILYKEIKKKRDDQEDEADEDQPAKQRAASRGRRLQSWTPEQLRRDIEAGTLQDGVYRSRYVAKWPSGETTNVVVWVKTGAGARDVQYYQEFPESVEFYQRYGRASGLSADDSDRIRRTMIDYNRDLWSLIVDRETGRATGRTPEIARAELRGIYGNLLKKTFEAAARILGAGAAITATANAMAPSGGAPSPVAPDSRSIPPREAPMPGWVNKAVDKGADEFFRQFERQLQGAR
jgi:hypothetical protein